VWIFEISMVTSIEGLLDSGEAWPGCRKAAALGTPLYLRINITGRAMNSR